MDRAKVPVNISAMSASGRFMEAKAAGFTPKINDVYQADPGCVAGTPLSAGEVFFIHQYALSLIGLADTPGAVPPDYT